MMRILILALIPGAAAIAWSVRGAVADWRRRLGDLQGAWVFGALVGAVTAAVLWLGLGVLTGVVAFAGYATFSEPRSGSWSEAIRLGLVPGCISGLIAYGFSFIPRVLGLAAVAIFR